MSLVNFKRRAEAVHYDGEVFEKLDLRSMKAFSSTWKDCIFRDCQFDLTDWRASKFEGCSFLRCEAQLVNFSTSFFDGCSFVGCNLEGSSFMGAMFTGQGLFDDCRLAYGDTLFQDATVKGFLLFLGSNLHGSNLDFREVVPKSVRFDGCNLWGVKMSMGCAAWEATYDERTCRRFVALVARHYPNLEVRSKLIEIAGREFAVVERAMTGRKYEHDAEGQNKPGGREVAGVLESRHYSESEFVLDLDDEPSIPTIQREREGTSLSSSSLSSGPWNTSYGTGSSLPESKVREPASPRSGVSSAEYSTRAESQSSENGMSEGSFIRLDRLSGGQVTIPSVSSVSKDQPAKEVTPKCTPASTTSPQITSTPIQNSQAQTATIPTPILKAMMNEY